MKILLTILFTSFAFGQVAAVNSGTAVYPSSGTIATTANIPCTSILAAGTNQIAAALAAHAVICLTGAQVQNTSTLTVSQADVTIECNGYQIQETTASVHLFTVTGARFKLRNCLLDGNSVNTHSAFSINATDPVLENLWLTNWGTGAAWGQITGGTGAMVRNINISGGSEHGLALSDASADFHAWRVVDSKISVAGDKIGLYITNVASNNNYDGEVSNLSMGATGSCIDIHVIGNNVPRNIGLSNINCELSGDTTLPLYSIFGCQYCAFTNLTAADNNHGMANAPGFAMHDLAFTTFIGGAFKTTNVGTQGFLALDSHDSEFGNITIGGGGGDLNNSAGRGMFEIGVSAPNSSMSNNSVHDVHLTMPSGATQYAFRFAEGLAAGDTFNNFIFHGNSAVGTASATALILSTGNSASFANPSIYGNTFDTFSTGINIGSGITSAKIGSNTFATTTTRFSDSGTSTILEPIQVAETTTTSRTTAITTTTLFTPDANAQYRVGGSINCDSTSAAATVNITIGWTDPGNQAQTQTLSSAAACTALGASSFGQLLFPFRAKSGTNITYATSIINTPTYDVSVHLEQVTTK